MLDLNREDGGNRRFIMVQLPEPTGNAEYPTIAEIGKERIRRVIARMRKADEGTLPLSTREEPEDLGFRVFRLAPASVRSWQPGSERTADAWLRQMELTGSRISADAEERDLIWEAAIREGYGLTAQVERVAAVTGPRVWQVSDADRDQSFFICLAQKIALEPLRALNLAHDNLFICRETALDDNHRRQSGAPVPPEDALARRRGGTPAMELKFDASQEYQLQGDRSGDTAL